MADGTVGGIAAAVAGAGGAAGHGTGTGGASLFQALLSSGAVPVASTETTGQIQAAYRDVLGREADAGALASYAARLARGGTIADVRAELAHSAEAAAGVEAAYREALGRGADAGGLSYAEAALAGGASLAEVQAGLAHSAEAAAGVQDAYRDVLGREAGAGELAHQQAVLASGRSVAEVRSELAHSAEATSALGAAHRAVLGREADAAALAYHQGRLAAGASLDEVRSGLARSPEATSGLAAACREVLGRDASAGELAELAGALARDGRPTGGLGELVRRSAVVDRAVDGLYREVLGRAATADERAERRASLSRPGATLASVLAEARSGLARSDEARGALDGAYRAVLGREADAGSLGYYTGVLASGRSLSEVRSGLAHSREASGGLQTSYGQTLGREADAAGLAYWQERLAGGATAEQVRSGIAHSDEVDGRVQALYRAALGREASAQDLDEFGDALARGGAQGGTGAREVGPMLDTLRAALFASEEAAGAVRQAYRDVLGREAEAGAVADFQSGQGWAGSVSDLRAKLAASDEAGAAVRALYAPTLGRAVTGAELAQARATLAGGGSLQGVLSGLLRSEGASASARQVNALYGAVLGRDADLDGLVYHQGRLAEGATVGGLRAGLARSGEAAAELDEVYRAVLGRGADAGGLAAHQEALARGGTLAEVRRDVAGTPEARARVQGLFAQHLGRVVSADEARGFEAGLASTAPARARFTVSTPEGGAGKLAEVDARMLVAQLGVYVTLSGGLTPTLTAPDGKVLGFRNAAELAGFALGLAQAQGVAGTSAWKTHGLTADWLGEVGQGYIQAAYTLQQGALASAAAGDAQNAYLQGVGAQLAMQIQQAPPGERHGLTKQVPLGAMTAEVSVSGDLSDPAGKGGFSYRLYDADPQRTALIERAREYATRAEQTQASGQAAEAAGDKGKAWSEGLLAYLHAAQARVHAAYAERPADRRSDKMLDVAQRFVDAAYAASGRGDWKLVQTLETAADISLQIAAKPEGERVRTTERFMHKEVKHDITVDPNSADPFATFSDHSKGKDVTGEIIEGVVGVVLHIAAVIPVTAPVAAPAAVAWDVAHAAKNFVDGNVLGGFLSLGSAVGTGLVGLDAIAQGASFGGMASQAAGVAIETAQAVNLTAAQLGAIEREVLAGTALVGGLSGVAQSAASGDALGIAAGVLQSAAAVASGLVAADALPAAAREFATKVAWGAGVASVGASSADAFAHGDLAGGLLSSVSLLLSEVAKEAFADVPAGGAGSAAASGQAAPGAPGAGARSGSGSSWFDLDASALGWGGTSGLAGVDVGSESAPPAVGGHTTVVQTPGGTGSGGATAGGVGSSGAGSGGAGTGWSDTGRFETAWFDVGGESAPGSARAPVSTSVSVPTGGAGAVPWSSWGAGRFDTGGEAAPTTQTQAPATQQQPARTLPTPPVPSEVGVTSSGAAREFADAAMTGVDGRTAIGRGGGTVVAATDEASSFGAAAGAPRDLGEATNLPGLDRQAPDGTPLPNADGTTARVIRRFVEGVGEGVADLAEGVWDVAKAAWRIDTDPAYRDRVVEGLDRLAREGNGALLAALADPRETAQTVARGARDLYDRFDAARAQAARDGVLPEFYARLVGRVGFEAGVLLLPAGITAKGAQTTNVVGKVGETANTTSKTADVARLADEGAGLAGGAAKPGGNVSTTGTPVGNAAQTGGVTGATDGAGKAQGFQAAGDAGESRATGRVTEPVDTGVSDQGGVVRGGTAAANAQKNADLNTLRARYPSEIDNVSTFVTRGVSESKAADFLTTPEGEQFLSELRAADPKASSNVIVNRAIEQIQSGSNVPRMEAVSSPLVKIVPEGQSVSRYSPYFTTEDELKRALSSGMRLGEYFGLPIKSQASVYDIYQITPLTSTNVFTSRVAPTTELGGLVTQPGSGIQIIVPDRSKFSDPVRIGKISS